MSLTDISTIIYANKSLNARNCSLLFARSKAQIFSTRFNTQLAHLPTCYKLIEALSPFGTTCSNLLTLHQNDKILKYPKLIESICAQQNKCVIFFSFY